MVCRWGKVMFLILSAKSLIWIVMYEHEHGSIFHNVGSIEFFSEPLDPCWAHYSNSHCKRKGDTRFYSVNLSSVLSRDQVARKKMPDIRHCVRILFRYWQFSTYSNTCMHWMKIFLQQIKYFCPCYSPAGRCGAGRVQVATQCQYSNIQPAPVAAGSGQVQRAPSPCLQNWP